MSTTGSCSRGTALFQSKPFRSWFWLAFLSPLVAFLALAGTSSAFAYDDPPPPCPDADGDGFVQCTASCTLPSGKSCGDCDDGDNKIFPNATCAICDGPGCPATFCVPGSTNRPCPAPAPLDSSSGFCLTVSAEVLTLPGFFCANDRNVPCTSDANCPGSTCTNMIFMGLGLECNADGSNDTCPAPAEVEQFMAEGGQATDAARRADAHCSDAEDNDCDGLVDLQDPGCQTAEFCDGLDNDGDGFIDETFPVGDPCTVGLGECQTSGFKICNQAQDGVVCSVSPAPPGTEGPFGSLSCADGLDNDCDGLTDFPSPANPLGDPSCTEAESCDGLDNDGDGLVDEGFALGVPCTTPPEILGACQTSGVTVCSPDGSSTVCNAVPALPSIEGPTNPASCGDLDDNDCDGDTDGNDPSCGSVGLRVTCALPFHTPPKGGRGRPGSDCNSWHKIEFEVPTEFSGAGVTAELLGVGLDGTILKALPVADGDVSHLASRIDPKDFDMFTEVTETGEVRHKVFAPIPMLRVTVDDGLRKASAFCSPIPYLQVMEPTGQVVTLNQSQNSSEPDVTRVVVALPREDPDKLMIKIDGVDLFAALGKMPSQCNAASPCSGPIMIGGVTVQVSDLIVDVAMDLATQSSNSMTLNLTGLGCGGHVAWVMGQRLPGSLPRPITAACHVDDMADRGTSYSFGIEITSPTPLETGVPVPTPVMGRVCHGLPFDSVTINGMEIFDPAGLIHTPGDGEDIADNFQFIIDTQLGQTNLARDMVFGDAPFGTFDPGSNFVLAAARDTLGKRAYNNAVAFSTEETALPGVGALPPAALTTAATNVFEPALNEAIEEQIEAAVRDALRSAAIAAIGDSISVPNAFVVGLSANAITNFFNNKCSAPDEISGRTIIERFAELAENSIRGRTFGPFSAPFPCSCDPSITLKVEEFDIDTNDFSCPVTFPGSLDQQGMEVPDGRLRVFINLPDITVTVAGSDSCRDTFLGVCIASAHASVRGNVRTDGIFLKFDVTESQLMGNIGPVGDFNAGVSANVAGSFEFHSDVGCIGGDICEFLVSAFTLGFLDVTPNIEIDTALSFSREIGEGRPDPIKLREIKVAEEEIENFNQKLAGDLVSVRITSAGIRASLNGRFSTNFIDPEILETPGTLLSPADPPAPDVAGPQSAFVVVADDTLNMLFSSLTLSGRLKSECSTSTDPNTGMPRTIGSLIPADCNTISLANDTSTALARGLCHGVRGANCETLAGPSFFTTPVEQGTCHGLRGDDCSMIATGFEGVVLPASCEDIVFGADDTDDPSRATAIAQGRCHGIRGDDCEALTSGSDADTAAKQGACWGEKNVDCELIPTGASPNVEKGTCHAIKGDACGDIPLLERPSCITANLQAGIIDSILRLAEQSACNLTPAVNVSASTTVLFCARQDVPPTFMIRDDPGTPPVEVGLRLGSLSLAVVLDRDGDGLDGALTSLAPCFGESAVATGDCSVAALCLNLNLVASMEIASTGDCPAGGDGVARPGFRARILEIQQLNRLFGLVCGGDSGGDDATFVNESSTGNASLDAVRNNAEDFAPPACIEGLRLGGFVTFVDPDLIAIDTPGGRPSVCDNNVDMPCTSNAQCPGGSCIALQDYLGLTVIIEP